MSLSRRQLLTSVLALTTVQYRTAFATDKVSALDQISQGLTKAPVLSADFSLSKRIPSLDRPLESSGRLVIWQDHGILWSTTDPFEETFVFNREKIGFADPDGQWRVKHNPSLGELFRQVEGLSRGDFSPIVRTFFLTVDGSSSAWSVLATPRSESIQQFISEAAFFGSQFIERAIFSLPDRSVSHLSLHHFHTAQEPTPSDRRLFALD